MPYTEHIPARPLLPFVECYWSHCSGPAEPAARRVLPDGCIDLLLVEREGEPRRLQIVGPMTSAEVFQSPAGCRFTGIRFRPAGAAALLAVDGRSLQDEVILMSDLGEVGIELLERIRSREPLESLALFLIQRLPSIPSAAVGFVRFFSALPADSRQWADFSGYSNRQLRRLFDCWVGLSPRQFRRITRLRRLVGVLPEAAGLAAAAARAGYCDQAHMNREVRRLTDVTPRQLRSVASLQSPAGAA